MAPSEPPAASRVLVRALPILLLATVALLGIRPISDGDVWWHLKNGEYFLEQRDFPEHDPFIFTGGASPWIVRAWLTEVIFALVFRLGGPNALILFKAALFALAVGILWRLGTVVRCPPPAAALVLLLASLAAWPRLAERPETFSFLLLAGALTILLRDDGGRGVALLVPIQILWANLHSSFLLGLFLPWPFVLDAATRRAGDTPAAAGRPAARRLAAVALLLWPASALTPEGTRLLLYPFRMARMPTLAVIDEVRGLVPILRLCSGCLEEGIAFLVLAAGTLAACGLQARAGRRAGPGTWLLAMGAAAAPFAVYRLLPYAGLILAGLALRNLGALVPMAGARQRAGAGPRMRPALAGAAAVVLLAVTAVHAVAGWRFPFGLGVARATFPQGAARFILDRDARGPLFNSLEFGGYLLWALYPRHRVFIHSAIWDSISDDHLVDRFLRSARDPAMFDALTRQYRIELVVLPSRLPSWGFVSGDPRFALIYWDEVASVYARRGGPNDALIAADEFRLTHYAADLSYLVPLARDGERFPAAAGELRRAVREDPENQAARLSLAFLLKTRGEGLLEALAAVEAAELRGVRNATLLTWKAEILGGLGRAADAEGAAREALKMDPHARTARLVLADLRAGAGDRAGAVRYLRELLGRPDLSPDLLREAEARLRALGAEP